MKFLKFMFFAWCLVNVCSMFCMAIGRIEPQHALVALVWLFYTHWQLNEKEKEAV